MFEQGHGSDIPAGTISITLISATETTAKTTLDGDTVRTVWMPKSFSDRDLEAPESFIRRVALDVIRFPPESLVIGHGFEQQSERLRGIRQLEFRAVQADAPERASILSLARLAKAALLAPTFPNDSSPWPFSEGQLAIIQRLRAEHLLKCGGLRLKGSIRIITSDEPLVEFAGRYAPKPDLSSATIEPGELVGVVTGHDKAKAVIHLQDQNERAFNIKFGKMEIGGKHLGELEDERALIAFEVNIGTGKNGETEYHYVSHRPYDAIAGGVSSVA